MDARDLPTLSSRTAQRLAQLAAIMLSVMIAWALWRGYGALLPSGHVH